MNIVIIKRRQPHKDLGAHCPRQREHQAEMNLVSLMSRVARWEGAASTWGWMGKQARRSRRGGEILFYLHQDSMGRLQDGEWCYMIYICKRSHLLVDGLWRGKSGSRRSLSRVLQLSRLGTVVAETGILAMVMERGGQMQRALWRWSRQELQAVRQNK